MNDDFKITINFERAKSIINKLKQINQAMDKCKTSTLGEDIAIKQWKEELY